MRPFGHLRVGLVLPNLYDDDHHDDYDDHDHDHDDVDDDDDDDETKCGFLSTKVYDLSFLACSKKVPKEKILFYHEVNCFSTKRRYTERPRR